MANGIYQIEEYGPQLDLLNKRNHKPLSMFGWRVIWFENEEAFKSENGKEVGLFETIEGARKFIRIVTGQEPEENQEFDNDEI